MSKNRPVVIGIAGGSGSGKTSVTNSIYEVFKEHSVVVIEQDYYYKDQSHLEFEERQEYAVFFGLVFRLDCGNRFLRAAAVLDHHDIHVIFG